MSRATPNVGKNFRTVSTCSTCKHAVSWIDGLFCRLNRPDMPVDPNDGFDQFDFAACDKHTDEMLQWLDLVSCVSANTTCDSWESR